MPCHTTQPDQTPHGVPPDGHQPALWHTKAPSYLLSADHAASNTLPDQTRLLLHLEVWYETGQPTYYSTTS